MILKRGSKGSEVKAVQAALSLVQDGIYGEVTEEAVRAFQKEHKLKVDGCVGVETLKALNLYKNTKRPIKCIIIHCSATPEGKDYTVEWIRNLHKKQGWSDIGYHFVVYRDGSVHEGRDINKVGSHCVGHNTGSIGVCYIGGVKADGKTAKDTRTPEQKKALASFVKRLMKQYGLSSNDVYCHNQFANKACPSFNVYDFRKELIYA